MEINTIKVNAFTDLKNGGNPAGVVLNSPILSERKMANITEILRVSESAFVFASKLADYKIRFFSPKIEVDLCGHATIATFFTLAVKGFITTNNCILSQETRAGILPIEVLFKHNFVDKVMMTLGKPVLKNIEFDFKEIANSLDISINEIDITLPKQIVSTGLFSLPVCINSFKILERIKPDFEKIKDICCSLNVGSFHLFTFETIDSDSVYHARNFAPYYSINEDPTTGTANGAICIYLFKNNLVKRKKLICEQGDIIGRPGRVFVEIDGDIVKVGGRGIIVEEKTVVV